MILCAIAFTFAAYQRSEAERQIQVAKNHELLANEFRFQLLKMELKFDSLNGQINKAKDNQ
jgi:hypothetical protein